MLEQENIKIRQEIILGKERVIEGSDVFMTLQIKSDWSEILK